MDGMQRTREIIHTGILLVTILLSSYYVPVSAQVPAYLPISIRESYSVNELPCDMAIASGHILGICSKTHSGWTTKLIAPPSTMSKFSLAPITSFTRVPHDHYLGGEAGNNINIALADTTVKLAVIGGVVFLAIIAALIRRWKKQSTHPSPYDPVPESQMGYVDHITLTSMTPEKISDVKVGEASSQEDELTGSVRRSSKSEVKRNLSRSTKRRPVATHPILLLKETEDRSTEEEEYYAPQPSRASRKAKRKSQRRSDRVTHDVDNSMAHIQGPGSTPNSPIGLPDRHFPHHASYCPICSLMYTTNPLFVPHNPYHPTHGHTYPLPVGLYGYNIGGPGTNVNSDAS
ncbi:hypothetical protein BYT27DRAFT_7341981 [Phlegmacium glaucopus]|nr:hypothetical protein BYT27DRAFT_7341981 [Phlegmacium glaucopus]